MEGDAGATGPVPERLYIASLNYQAAERLHWSQPPAHPDDEELDFAKVLAALEEHQCPDFGRPAIRPVGVARTILSGPLKNIGYCRRLSSAISEDLAFRWSCFQTTDEPVFDDSRITHFIYRSGREGLASISDGLKQELLRLGYSYY